MALTRITQTVVGTGAIATDSLANGSISARAIALGAITADKLAANVISGGPIAANINIVQNNVTALTANVDVVQDNVAAITDATTDLNIGSGKYFFDKSITSLGINNTEPIAGTVSLGTPANVILNYQQGLGGNVYIGVPNTLSPYRLDVHGTANTGTFRATQIGIGTAPTRPLTIESGENEQIRLINTHNGGDVKIEYRNSFGTDTNWFGGLEESDGSFRINFKEADISSAEDTYLAIKKTMQMGVGTASPDANLHVVGTGHITGQVNVDDDLVITGNVGLAGNTAPALNTISLGAPANVVIRAVSDKDGNVIIGDPTATSSYNLDVRGTANVGALTVDSLSGLSSLIVSDGGTVGSTSTTDAITISAAGIVTFKDDIIIKDGGTIGVTSKVDAVTLASDGAITLVDDLAVTGNTVVTLGLAVAANTAPAIDTASFGNPANVIVRAVSQKGGNVIIGDSTATTSHNLDVRGTANTGALTATTIVLSDDGGVQVPNDGNIGSAGATDAMQIDSAGIVTFKDDIKVKDDGTIGSASVPTAITIDSSGIVAFVDDIKVKDDGTIGSASAPTAMTIDSAGIVAFVDDIKIKDGGTIGSATTPGAVTIASDGFVTITDDMTVTGNLQVHGETITANTTNIVVRDQFIALANGGAKTADTGVFYTRGTEGNAVIWYDASENSFYMSESRNEYSDTSITPTSAANLNVGLLEATSITLSGDAGVLVPNDGNIGSAGATDAMQIDSAGIVTFKDDIKIKDGGTIGVASKTDAVTIASDGAVTLVDDLAVTGNITSTLQTVVTTGLGVAANTAPIATGVSLGTPANVVIRSVAGKSGNVIIGDPTHTTGVSLDVRGTANVGALTATSVTASTVEADGGITVDNITIDGTEIDLSSGDLTVDVAGDINLDAGGGDIFLQKAGATFGKISDTGGGEVIYGADPTGTSTDLFLSHGNGGLIKIISDHNTSNTVGSMGKLVGSDHFYFQTSVSDADLIIRGSDDGSSVTAATFDMSDAGTLILNHDLDIDEDGGIIYMGGDRDVSLTHVHDTGVALNKGLGVVSNTLPRANTISVGNPANVIIQANPTTGGTIVIGHPTYTSGTHSLDVRGTANTGALTSTAVTVSGLTASRVLQTDGSKGLESSAVTTTELGYLDGVSSAIQTQLDAKIATTSSASNDFVTYARLNANLNVIQDNVASLSGAIQLNPFTNAITQTGTANTFFLGKAMPGDGLANVLNVSIDGVAQIKDQPGTANNDFIMNAVAAHASIQFTAPSIPAGSRIQTIILHS